MHIRHSFQAPAAAALLAAVSFGCKEEKPSEPPPPYDLLCPSPGSSCPDASGALLVGAAKRDITPEVIETFRDCGLDGLCPGEAGYPGPDQGEGNTELDGHPTVINGPEPVDDVNGNGYFDAVWIAGYGNNRPAQGVHDPVWARTVVLRKGGTTLALVALDVVGYFYDEVERVRAALDPALGVDLLLVSATHTHENADTVGIWGFDEGTSGVDPAYLARIREAIVDTVTEAVANLTEARVIAAVGASGVHPDATVTAERGINNLIQDGRDPAIIDDEMRVLRFVSAADGAGIATLVNWQNHPESLCEMNRYISSDFAHYLREGVESGVARGGVNETGLDGLAIFVNGAVGGMQSPGRVRVIDLDGTEIPFTCKYTESVDDVAFERPRAFGQLAALDALRILRDYGEELEETSLSFATRSFLLPIENWGYHAMFLTGVFYGRHMYDWDRSRQITEDNLPKIKTEVAVVRLGPVEAITIPGELLPEWYLGGYDGSATGPMQSVIDAWYNQMPASPTSCIAASDCAGVELLPGYACDATRCICRDNVCLSNRYNPPALDLAPGPPYLRDKMAGRIKLVLGLTQDELGYIVPPYDFQLDERLPYLEEAPGDHYEETNSIGVSVGPAVVESLDGLFGVLH